MKACRRKYIEWGAAGIGALALFLFFFRILPYHLFHREQTQLFLLATEPLAGYLRHPAALARLSGDFLTQFFYYEGGGPTIMAVVLLLWGVVEEFLDIISGEKSESTYITSLDRSLQSHYCALAAEYSRLHDGKPVDIETFR